MMQAVRLRTVRYATLAVLAITLLAMHDRAVSQEKAEDQAPAPATAKVRKFRGRLPNYYSQVVDQQQREKIYAIQREYKPKIDALKAQLAALTKERDDEVSEVLTPQQREKIEQLREEAKAKREAKRKPKAPPAAAKELPEPKA